MRLARARNASGTAVPVTSVEHEGEEVIVDLTATAAEFGDDALRSSLFELANWDLIGWLEHPDGMELLRRAHDLAVRSVADGRSRPPAAGSQMAPLFDVPRKLMGVGLNFPSHIAEAQRAGEPVDTPPEPPLFTKVPTAVSGDGDEVRIPPFGTDFDYEAELGVIIGERCRDLEPDDVPAVIAGFTVVNDMSLRDIQFQPGKVFEAKNYDGFLPMSSWMTTADEVDDVAELILESRVNGELRQSERQGNSVFSPNEIISFASKRMTLEAGDLVFCGTPEGVGIFAEDPRSKLLKPGDEVVASVAGIGSVATRVVG